MKNNFLGTKLKKLRIAKHYKLKSICDILASQNLPISIKTLYKWESGETIPDLKYLNALAAIYGTNIASIFDDSSECQALDDMELDFINTLRNNSIYKKIISLILKEDKEAHKYADKVIC